MKKTGLVKIPDMKAHLRTDWRKVHNLWEHIKPYIQETQGYTKDEIDAFFEGEAAGKKQVHWDRITSKPFPDTIANVLSDHDKAAHDALAINAGQVDGIEGAELLQRDGSIPLTSDWDAGNKEITANQFRALAGGHIRLGEGINKLRIVYDSDEIAKILGVSNNIAGLKIAKAIIGAFELNSLVANNKVPDSDKLGGVVASSYALTTRKLDDFGEPDDNIDLNVSISRHGLFPKLSNNYQEFLGGTGQWKKLVSSSGIAVYILSKASTTTRNSNDTERTTSDPSYVKIKETKLGEPTGKMKIYFELKISNASYTAYAKIYKNGSPIGYEQSTSSTSYVPFSQNLGGFDSQDLIQIYAYRSPAGGAHLASVRNLRFQYDRAITKFGDWEIATPITTVSQTAFSMQHQDP